MKICSLGAGAMGGMFGAYLSRHHEVHMLDTYQELVDKINQEGLVIQKNGVDEVFHPQAHTTADEIGVCDLVIVFIKTYLTEQVLRMHPALFGEHTMVLSLQNGLNNEENFLKVLPAKNIIMGTTQMTANILGLAHVRNNGGLTTHIGPLDEANMGRAEEIAAALNEAGFVTEACGPREVQQMIWNKLLINSSGNPLNALFNANNTIFFECESAHNVLECLVNESCGIARAAGFEADPKVFLGKVEALLKNSPNHKSSMMQDREFKRKTEIDQINGQIVATAKKLGMPAPYNETIVNFVHVMEATY